eukprot:TRINITY_DN26211_c0_g1_i1.p1 TRINITY_DN26211_c0_g1~~TRINITY_DN26211_c0_g1_i1.p1  ORF type:complete len:171 (-),score=9.40 TRINITY_DN26211_c0_g1_i1:158-670(-)
MAPRRAASSRSRSRSRRRARRSDVRSRSRSKSKHRERRRGSGSRSPARPLHRGAQQDSNRWICKCGLANPLSRTHCIKCYLPPQGTKRDKEETDLLDEYGRKRSAASAPGNERRRKEDSGSATANERHKAALERLRARKQFSPPRTRVYREKSSRSRSLERKREAKVFIG